MLLWSSATLVCRFRSLIIMYGVSKSGVHLTGTLSEPAHLCHSIVLPILPILIDDFLAILTTLTR